VRLDVADVLPLAACPKGQCLLKTKNYRDGNIKLSTAKLRPQGLVSNSTIDRHHVYSIEIATCRRIISRYEPLYGCVYKGPLELVTTEQVSEREWICNTVYVRLMPSVARNVCQFNAER
jgi:hypothetical protein